jgi:drug/metabolite transporter (DMT)-like permease
MRAVTLQRVSRGAVAGLVAAALFGAGAPVAKLLLGQVEPWLLAGLLYTASGIALFGWRTVRRAPRVRLPRQDRAPLIGAVFFGGLVAPVLLMLGLVAMPASGASLLLNAEGLFTALIAWLVLREATDRRIVLGFVLIAAGAVVLSWPGQAQFAGLWPTLAVLGACLSWGIDNNLTQRVALNDAAWLAAVKGAVAGPVNLALAFLLGAQLPSFPAAIGAAAVGIASYGISLVLFISALGLLGTARAGAYFSVAPFFGATLAIALGEPITWTLVVAAVLMGAGVLLHLGEHHDHAHTHEAVRHEHLHSHDDDHHDHRHGASVPPGTRHRHVHDHAAMTHSHEHFPDAVHRHRHPDH